MSSLIKTSGLQPGVGGWSPTLTHQFKIEVADKKAVTALVEKWHYSHSTFGVNGKINLGLFDGSKLVGCAIIGQPATHTVAAKYNEGGTIKVLELRRFCLEDEAPKNSESYFLGKIAWWLKKNSDVDLVISYADSTYGHAGTIYKAANWKLIGVSAPKKKILWKGRYFHQRAIHQKNFPAQVAATKAALASGEASWVLTGSKNVFAYRIPRR